MIKGKGKISLIRHFESGICRIDDSNHIDYEINEINNEINILY